jgi:hypothetical protein
MFGHTSLCIWFILVKWFDQNPKWVQIVLKRDWKIGLRKRKEFLLCPSFLLFGPHGLPLFPTKARPSLARRLPHSPAGPAGLSPRTDATPLLPRSAGPNWSAQGWSPMCGAHPLPSLSVSLPSQPCSLFRWRTGPTCWRRLPPRVVPSSDSSPMETAAASAFFGIWRALNAEHPYISRAPCHIARIQP